MADDLDPGEEYPLKELTQKIIAAAIEVHRLLGPGYLEKIYVRALIIELESRGHQVKQQLTVNVLYRGKPVGQHRVDLLVDDQVVLELKSVDALCNAHKAQLRSTLRAIGRQVGLLINFNQETLAKGLKRVIN